MTYFVGLYNSLAVDRVTDGVQDLADAYVLTGNRRYAQVLSVLLDALAATPPRARDAPITRRTCSATAPSTASAR